MAVVTIIGAGMMGSALAFPARENGHEVRLVGTHLDREIIYECKASGKHPKFDIPFPSGVEYYYIDELSKALCGADFVIGGVSSFGRVGSLRSLHGFRGLGSRRGLHGLRGFRLRRLGGLW